VTVPAATYQTFQQVGRREDLSNMIYNISPTEKPFTSAVRKVKAKQSKHEWQTDALASASPTASAIIEGDDATANTADPTTRLNNQLQTFRKVVQVSGRAQAVDLAGRADEFEYQLKKRMAELGRDLEAALTQNNASTAGSASSAPLMASAESWLATNKTSVGTGTAQTTPGADGTVGSPITAPTDSTVAGTLTEAALKNVIKLCYDNGDAAPTLVMVGSQIKQKISGSFTGISTRYTDVGKSQAAIVSGADVYVGDFGKLTIVPNRFMRTKTVLVLNPDFWAIASLRGFQMQRLGKTGDSDRAQIVGDYTLECRNEKASGKITDVDGTL
jgi:hypothetical protein